ncbi:MAG: hypothetical protein VW338_19490 [Rhodospirillaceae bacterium]
MTEFLHMDGGGTSSQRRFSLGVLFSTTGAVADVEDWLDESCTGDWNLAVEGMDETLTKKSLRILFEKEADKQVFITNFARR